MNTTWNDSRFGPGSYEHASQEDRSAPRVRVHIAASLRPAGVRAFQTTIRDLSLGGFTATSSSRLEARNFCWLTIPGFAPITRDSRWTNEGRRADQGTIHLDIAAITRQRTTAELVQQFGQAGIPHSPIHDIPSVRDLPAVRDQLTTTRRPDGSLLHMQPAAVTVGQAPRELGFAPKYGQDTTSVLREAGLSDSEIERLAENGVIHGSTASN